MRIANGFIILCGRPAGRQILEDFIFEEAYLCKGNVGHIYFGNWNHPGCYWLVLK